MIDVVSEQHLSERDFQKLCELIYRACGIHLVPAKKTMVELRLRRRLEALQIGFFETIWTI